VRLLNGITERRGLPGAIKTDNGSEFISNLKADLAISSTE